MGPALLQGGMLAAKTAILMLYDSQAQI